MAESSPSRSNAAGTGAQFTPTHWTIVLAAADRLSPDADEALATLCRKYWYPLYAFIRRRGHSPHEAQDLTQGFFASLIEREALRTVDREKGRFRTFLLAALNNFVHDAWGRRTAQKRGGTQSPVSLDEMLAEERYAHELSEEAAPEALFDQRWAGAVVEQVMARLQTEYTASGRGEVFGALQSYLTGEIGPGAYADAGTRLRMNDGAVKVALHRLRRRFGEMLRDEIAQTVTQPEDVDAEIRHLFAALGAPSTGDHAG